MLSCTGGWWPNNKMTLWTLDTCGFDPRTENCQINIDDTNGTMSFVRKCPAHQNVNDPAQVHQENIRGASNTLDHLLQNAPSGLFDVNADGSRTFKRGITVDWSWTGTAPDRVLNIDVTGFSPTTTQRNAITTALNNRFGAGNVTVTFG